MSDLLFAPVRLGNLELSNRVVMAPMTRMRAAADGTPTELMAAYYEQRASAGLIVAEMTVVSPTGRAYLNAPELHRTSDVEAWRRVTDAVHSAGGRIVVQLGHAGRISHPLLQPDGIQPVAPSAVKPQGRIYTQDGPKPFETPRALEQSEIGAIVDEFRHAARLAKEAGFDGIELHAANGYLLDQFLRDGSNHRTDEYGGSAANRARLLIEVASATFEIWDPARIGVRLSPYNPYNDMSDTDPAATFSTIASLLAPLGLAYLHVVEPVAPQSASLTVALGALFDGPVIANGGHTADTARSAIETGQADAVAFGAPYVANPDLVERLQRRLPLATADPATIYGGGAKGYVDYPAYVAAAA